MNRTNGLMAVPPQGLMGRASQAEGAWSLVHYSLNIGRRAGYAR
jgi:hypothetical protein